ncbi:tyrosine-type recombinase/integrase [Rickettsiales bacterium]|nr:tyrosine-type recombinase/integrase [Rickettsiales bacterium]
MTKEFNFTEARLKALPSPAKGRAYYKDSKEKGLSLYITTNGTITFFVRKRINGKDERIILGNYPTTTVKEARDEAINAKSLASKGKNPNSEKRKIRDECTFKELFDRYIDDYAKLHTRSWQHDIEDINRNLSQWFKRKISSITTEEIRKLHADFGAKRGKYGANRLLDRINAIYNKAILWGWDGKNPAKAVTKFKMQSRDRFLQPYEMPVLFEALSEEGNEVVRDYILLSLLTGARKGNVLAMRWNEIDLDSKTWRIPKTKNDEPLTVPLTDQAIDILKGRKKANTKLSYGKSEFVFPGTGEGGHLADPKKAWQRIKLEATIKLWKKDIEISPLIKEVKKASNNSMTVFVLYKKICDIAQKRNIAPPFGLTDVRLHDLRRTLGSWQAATGATTAIIGKSLGHKSQKATAVYERLNIDPVRTSVERATEAMFGSGNKQ